MKFFNESNIFFKRLFKKVVFLIPALFAVLILRMLRPWLLIRIGVLISDRIGHFVGNVEIYLCEKQEKINQPLTRHIDIFYMQENKICNQQVAIMWKRELHIWPSWFVGPILVINNIIPGGSAHLVGNNTFHDKDVHGLLDRQPSHLKFSDEEIIKGKKELVKMGLSDDSAFVCLSVRDSAYLSGDYWSYHNYRDSDIKNYRIAAEALASRGLYVIRMGAKVKDKMNSNNHLIIDYATNGNRSEFMDVYLGAKCLFCISSGSGWDSIPIAFRRPVVYANYTAFAFQYTAEKIFLAIPKHHYSIKLKRKLSIFEIVESDVGYAFRSKDYLDNDIILIENTPEEILYLSIEALERITGNWIETIKDIELQELFLSKIPKNKVKDLQGNFLKPHSSSRVGISFLKNSVPLKKLF